MSQDHAKQKKPNWGGSLWGPLIFFVIGFFFFIEPERMISTLGKSAYESLPNKAWFGYALGIICCSSAIIFHTDGYWKPKGYRKISTCVLAIGVACNLAGWAYVMWSIGSPWS